MSECDACILCLPDAAAVETVALLDAAGNKNTVVIDASTAHRTDPAWDYGFPELNPAQREKLTNSKRIANPVSRRPTYDVTANLSDRGVAEETKNHPSATPPNL